MYHIHRTFAFPQIVIPLRVSVPGRAGKTVSLTLVLEGNIPRFPWTTIVPSTSKLTCGLTRNTETTGSTETPQ
jgi:hypothetical protein